MKPNSSSPINGWEDFRRITPEEWEIIHLIGSWSRFKGTSLTSEDGHYVHILINYFKAKYETHEPEED